MHLKSWITIAAFIATAAAAPVGLEERDKGIYSYYVPPAKTDASDGKRDVGIYSYYVPPAKTDASKGKRDEDASYGRKRDKGIYSYYVPPQESKREATAQDFEDQVARDE